MSTTVVDKTVDHLFREAGTHDVSLGKPVNDGLLRDRYEVLKWGPPSANSSPARFLFLRTLEAKERLRPLPETSKKLLTTGVEGLS